jgi:para-aminobenzoate synthetase component I
MEKTRTFRSFLIKDFISCKLQMLKWANQFSICCFLDNNQYESSHHSNECLLGAGVYSSTNIGKGNSLTVLKEFIAKHNDWLFGHLSYELKNEIDGLSSLKPDHIGFPELYFFQPEIMLLLDENELRVGSMNNDHLFIFESILKQSTKEEHPPHPDAGIHQRMTKAGYLETIKKLKDHIRRGDCYEINYCQEFYATDITIDPLLVFSNLTRISPNPFSAFYKSGSRYLLCASPERYLKKNGQRIISQPIKGTSQRVLNNAQQDQVQKDALYANPKERSENVMVVDLVRNDLSRVCMEGTVTVDELFGIYTFPQVHQMVSTVSGTLKPGMDFTDIIRASFPMGSMTGAPKRSVMELIEQYEQSHRGLFSGAVGYIDPNGDFDFNVVIRSILYNAETSYLSYSTGSAITHYSDPESEYAECLLKGEAIRQVLQGKI